MPEVADVCRRSGPAARARVGEGLLPSHRRALDDRVHCRSAASVGHLWPCDPCGPEPDVDHACRNRSGPSGPRRDTDAWLAARRPERLPVPSVHVVFPVPHALGESIRRYPRDLYDIGLRAAAQSLLKLAADPHEVGGLSGVLSVRHTGTRPLADHPHVHGLVPTGGVSADRSAWWPARQSSRLPVPALATLFRWRFRTLVHQARPDLTMPEAVWTKGWVVDGNPTVHGPEPVLTSLGRDVPRLALTTHRLLSIEAGQVCCRDQDAQTSRGHTMPSKLRRVAAASGRTCGPTASTRSGTMGCGVPSLVPSGTNASARWRGPHPSHLPLPLHGSAIRPMAGAHPCAPVRRVRMAAQACWS